MWTCPKCKRVFGRANQMHSCRNVPLGKHFEGKNKAKDLFDKLVKDINDRVGETQTISIPCCIHLFGKYDFLAALPKTDRLELRFALDKIIDTPRLKSSVPLSKKTYKNVIDVNKIEEIDSELMGWIKESYFLKDK